MFAVTVFFTIKPDHMARFLPLMRQNAATSLQEEPGCQQFDICTDPSVPDTVFLYELYDDCAAFDQHLASGHFKRFDASVADMIINKRIQLFESVTQ